MARNRLLAGLVLAAGAAAAATAYRRRAARRRERVDLYADDGAMVSVTDGAPEAARLLAIARELIQFGS
jgi:hypothetical protein